MAAALFARALEPGGEVDVRLGVGWVERQRPFVSGSRGGELPIAASRGAQKRGRPEPSP